MNGTKPIRQVLADNFNAIRSASRSLSSLPLIAKAGGPANGTLGRILKMENGATIDTLEALAHAFGVQAWQLLLPGLKAAPNGTNHPTLVNVPGWPFSTVAQDRYDALSDEDKGFVQARFLAAIEEREAAKPAKRNFKLVKPKESTKPQAKKEGVDL